MIIITTATEIRDYITNSNPVGAALAEPGDIDRIVDAIQRADHPAYGEDWEAWLDEHSERIAEEALS